MFCQNCGNSIQEDSQFCTQCGSAVGNGASGETNVKDQAVNAPEASTAEGQAYSAPAGIAPEGAVGTQVLERAADQAAGASGGWYPYGQPAAPESTGNKARVCKDCGAPIDSKTKKCTGCGKQNLQPKKAIVWAAAIVVIVALAGLNVLQYLESGEQREALKASNTEIADQKEQLEDKNDTIKSQEDTIADLQSSIDELQLQAGDMQATIDALNSNESAYLDKVTFMDDYVVIVPDDGTNTYHKYGCEYLNMDTFWIYNIDAAIAMEYDACPYCT